MYVKLSYVIFRRLVEGLHSHKNEAPASFSRCRFVVITLYWLTVDTQEGLITLTTKVTT